MSNFLKRAALCATFSTTLAAAEITIPLTGSDPVAQHTAKFQCDQHGSEIGLPTGIFKVQYLDGAGNSLAVLPIGGKSLIFSKVMSASGVRYAAGQYIWWDAGKRGVHLYSDSLSGKDQASCQEVR